MRATAITFALLTSLSLHAQDPLTIHGKILDRSTGAPLPFAQITISSAAMGTTSNEEGAFLLNIPFLLRNDSLLVAYLGYEPQKIAIGRLTQDAAVIRLKPRAIQLSEVEVVGLTPEEVIRRAVAHIPENYGTDSVLLTAYIRVQKIVGNRLAEYTEAIVQDLKDGYYLYPQRDMRKKNDRSNIPLLLKGRVKSDTNLVNSMGNIGRQAFCLSCSFVLDVAEIYHGTALDEDLFKVYEYHMKEVPDGPWGKLYDITFDQKKDLNEMYYQGEILINASDYAILKMVYKPSLRAFDQYEKAKLKRPYDLNGSSGWVMEMPMGENTITYTKRNGRWGLATVQTDYMMIFNNVMSRQKMRYHYKSDVVVTSETWDRKIVGTFKGNKSLGVGQRWDQIVGPLDAAFWKSYNYLPVEESLEGEIDKLPDGAK
jgi:hypothetical protein